MASKRTKSCSISPVIRELQIQTVRSHYIHPRTAKIQNTDTKCLVRSWSKRRSLTSRGMATIGQTALKYNVVVSYKATKSLLGHSLVIALVGIYPNALKTYQPIIIHGMFVHNGSNLETIRKSSVGK